MGIWKKKTRHKVQEAIDVVMCRSKETTLCRQRPLRVRRNAGFLVNASSLKKWKDVEDGMNGSYTKVLRYSTWTVESFQFGDHMQSSIIAKKRVEVEVDNRYYLLINSKCNKVCPDLVM